MLDLPIKDSIVRTCFVFVLNLLMERLTLNIVGMLALPMKDSIIRTCFVFVLNLLIKRITYMHIKYCMYASLIPACRGLLHIYRYILQLVLVCHIRLSPMKIQL